jgi:hypothetical protein
VATFGAGCSDDGGDGDRPPAEIRGAWERGEVQTHGDVFFTFDRVAVGGSPDTVAWVTRRTRGDTGDLAYSEMLAGADATSVDLPVADGGPAVLIPVGVATDAEGWAAVAATRDQPRGENTGLLAWQTRRTNASAPEVPPGVPLVPPPGVSGAPQLASIGRANGASLVAALVGGQVVLWSLPEGAGENGGAAPPLAGWEASQPDLELDGELVHLRVTGDGERFVLAGVDDEAGGHVWTSTDGESWEPVPDDHLPGDVGAVGLLTPVAGGQVVVGWLADEDSAPANATSATIQRLEGDGLSDEGAITSDSGTRIDRIDLAGAARSPADRLVVVGAAVRSSGDRTPMVWVRHGGDWTPTRRPELTNRLDYELRAVTTDDDRMVGIVTGVAHVDVETWRWHPPDD